MPDAWNNGNAMSTSSEERRRTEAALVRAVEMNPDVEAEETHSAICAYVDALSEDKLLPEAVVIAFKTALAKAASLHLLEADAREQVRAALVSACIRRYFTRRVPDDMRVARAPGLRLVREERDPPRRAPDASA